MRRRRGDREIGLRELPPPDGLEVLELVDAGHSAAPPLRLFAGLPEPLEAPYARDEEDRIGSAGLWRAIANL